MPLYTSTATLFFLLLCFYCATNWKIHENYGLHFCFLQASELILCCLGNTQCFQKLNSIKMAKWRSCNIFPIYLSTYTIMCLVKWDLFGDFNLTQRAERVGQWCYSWERKNNVKLPKHSTLPCTLQQSAWCVCVPLQTNHTEGNSSQLFTFVKSSSSGHAIATVLCF